MKFLDNLSGYAHWALRLALGSVFLYHGLSKFPGAAGLASMMSMPIAAIYMLGAIEALGGALVLIGGFTSSLITRIGSLILMPPMLGAIMLVHWGQWSFAPSATHPMGGMEFQVTLLLIMVFLFLKGNSVNKNNE